MLAQNAAETEHTPVAGGDAPAGGMESGLEDGSEVFTLHPFSFVHHEDLYGFIRGAGGDADAPPAATECVGGVRQQTVEDGAELSGPAENLGEGVEVQFNRDLVLGLGRKEGRGIAEEFIHVGFEDIGAVEVGEALHPVDDLGEARRGLVKRPAKIRLEAEKALVIGAVGGGEAGIDEQEGIDGALQGADGGIEFVAECGSEAAEAGGVIAEQDPGFGTAELFSGFETADVALVVQVALAIEDGGEGSGHERDGLEKEQVLGDGAAADTEVLFGEVGLKEVDNTQREAEGESLHGAEGDSGYADEQNEGNLARNIRLDSGLEGADAKGDLIQGDGNQDSEDHGKETGVALPEGGARGSEGEQSEADEPDGGGQAVDEGQPVDGHQQEAAEGGEERDTDGDPGRDFEAKQTQAGNELVKTGFPFSGSREDVGAQLAQVHTPESSAAPEGARRPMVHSGFAQAP